MGVHELSWYKQIVSCTALGGSRTLKIAVFSIDQNPVHTGLGSCFGACLLSLLAWLLHSWRVLTIATSAIVALAACVVVPVLPESPRWLLNNGRKVTHPIPQLRWQTQSE